MSTIALPLTLLILFFVGTTAADQDWSESMRRAAPLVFGFVLVFAFLVLLASFRSIVVALKAIVLDLLSAAVPAPAPALRRAA